jgi:hypothetical protein
MKQINSEYLAHFVELQRQLDMANGALPSNIATETVSTEQVKVKQSVIDAVQLAIDVFDTNVHEWENIPINDTIDHQTGFVTEG